MTLKKWWWRPDPITVPCATCMQPVGQPCVYVVMQIKYPNGAKPKQRYAIEKQHEESLQRAGTPTSRPHAIRFEQAWQTIRGGTVIVEKLYGQSGRYVEIDITQTFQLKIRLCGRTGLHSTVTAATPDDAQDVIRDWLGSRISTELRRPYQACLEDAGQLVDTDAGLG